MEKMRTLMRKYFWVGFAGILWFGLLGAGFGFLVVYQTTPGIMEQVLAEWPRESALARSPDRPTLVLFAHPHCPCTRASADSLSWIMEKAGGNVAAHVVLFKSPEFKTGWIDTNLYDTFKKIPGVTVHEDVGGKEIRTFRADISGETVLYGVDGKLLYGGGITAARGHAGDNEGRNAVVSLVKGNRANSHFPVFGCSLLDTKTTPIVNTPLRRIQAWMQKRFM